jgi:hypothetical protein
MISTLLHLLRLCPFLCGGHRQLALENLDLRLSDEWLRPIPCGAPPESMAKLLKLGIDGRNAPSQG